MNNKILIEDIFEGNRKLTLFVKSIYWKKKKNKNIRIRKVTLFNTNEYSLQNYHKIIHPISLNEIL